MKSNLRLFRHGPDGSWAPSVETTSIVTSFAAMAYHRRWGYMLAWGRPPNTWDRLPVTGPFFIRGESVSKFFDAPAESRKPWSPGRVLIERKQR